MTDLTFSACQGHPLSFINGKFFNLLSVCQNPGGRKRAKYMYGFGPFSLSATGSIYTDTPPKVRSSQSVTKQVDRKSSMDRTGRVGLPGVTDDYPPTICKKKQLGAPPPCPIWVTKSLRILVMHLGWSETPTGCLTTTVKSLGVVEVSSANERQYSVGKVAYLVKRISDNDVVEPALVYRFTR